METVLIADESLTKKPEVHLLPCKVSHDGAANVRSYFSSSILRTTSPDQNVESIQLFLNLNFNLKNRCKL
jgi:hypothetical protein